MLPVLIKRAGRSTSGRIDEHGVTMALVALSMVAIISFAALAIDLGSLYEAKDEAQRAADAAALAAARVISISGITGDPTNGASGWATVCGGTTSVASSVATTVAQQNQVGGAPLVAANINVYYGNSGTNSDCTAAAAGSTFGTNPIVSVVVQQPKLPNFFAHIFSLMPGSTTSNSGVSATAYAEAFNPSETGGAAGNAMIPVQPRCVKPWMVPNMEPAKAGVAFVSAAGSINNPGINSVNGGVIGETFLLGSDCTVNRTNCEPGNLYDNPPQYNGPNNPTPNVLEYIPALVSGTPVAVPSCVTSTTFQPAIAGCDQSTVYACGVLDGTTVDLTENPVNPTGLTGDSGTAAQCLVNYGGAAGGYDSIDTAGVNQTPTLFPILIHAGDNNPLVKAGLVASNDYVSTSNSIVTIPIITTDSGGQLAGAKPAVTVVGFLQVFIQSFGTDPQGNMRATVLNISGCGNSATNSPLFGTSPVPVRLIAQPPPS